MRYSKWHHQHVRCQGKQVGVGASCNKHFALCTILMCITGANDLLFKATISILMLYMAATLLAVLGLREVQYRAISVTLHTSTPFGGIHGSHRLLAACFQLRLYIPSILHGLQVT